MVADHLRREIFAGRLGPGDRIAQEAVANDLGVSRIPVREALVILEGEGRIELEHHRGAFVLAMDESSVRDNAEIYGMVFGFVARRAAERADDSLVERLQGLVSRLGDAHEPETVWRFNEGYLDIVIEFGAAPRLSGVLRKMRALAVDNLYEVAPETLEIARDGTLALIDAICAGDGERAEAVQIDMRRRSAELVVEAFTRRGMLDSDLEP